MKKSGAVRADRAFFLLLCPKNENETETKVGILSHF